jgi:hypothetical protein
MLKRKIFFLAFLIILTVTAPAQEQNDFLFIAENGGITITGYSGSARDIVIPETINGLPVIAIGPGVFERYSLTKVTLPNTVTVIGDRAFAYNRLAELTLPASIVSVGYRAFSSNRLANLNLPDSITTIGMYAFSENRLKSLYLPSSLTYIGDGSFTRNFLKEISVPNTVKNFNSRAFDGQVKISWH